MAFPAVHPPQPPMMGWPPASFHPKLSPIDSPQLPSPLSPFPFTESSPIVNRNHVCSPALSPAPASTKTASATTQAKRTRRKPCLNCAACRRSENCGRCAVCTNPNATNSICKQRKCEELRRRPSQLGATTTATQRSSLNGPLDQSDDSNDTTTFNVLAAQRQMNDELAPLPVKADLNLSFPNGVHLPERKKRKTSTHQAKVQVKISPPCGCPGSDHGNYYTHLGAADSPEQLRKTMEERLRVSGEALRMIEITYTGIEAKTAEGCPTAEWVVRRRAKEEKFTVLFRHHRGHTCGEQYTVVSCVFWDAIEPEKASYLYRRLTDVLPKYGLPTSRQCEYNNSKTCTCQGLNRDFGGASYSFGCSWSVYYNGCKFGRSKIPRKFRLNVADKEEELDRDIQSLATDMAPVYKWLAPAAYGNQVATQESGQECRLGYGEEKPFSGMTCCMDFCAHSHYDRHNMPNGGATVVVTILKEGVYGEGSSNGVEQLHALPFYRLKDPPKTSIPGIEVRPVESAWKPEPASMESPSTGTASPAAAMGAFQHHPLSSGPLPGMPPSSSLSTGYSSANSGGVPVPSRLLGSNSRPISAVLPATCLSSGVTPGSSHGFTSPLSVTQRPPLLADGSLREPLPPSPSPTLCRQTPGMPLSSSSASSAAGISTSGRPPMSSNTSFTRTSSGGQVTSSPEAVTSVKLEPVDPPDVSHPPLVSPNKTKQFSISNLLSGPNSKQTSAVETPTHSQVKLESPAVTPSSSAQFPPNGIHINGVVTPGREQLLNASAKFAQGPFPHKNGFTVNGIRSSQHFAAAGGGSVSNSVPLPVLDSNGSSTESDSDCCILTDSPDPSPPMPIQTTASTTLHVKQEAPPPMTPQGHQLVQSSSLPPAGSVPHLLNGMVEARTPTSKDLAPPMTRVLNGFPASSAQLPQMQSVMASPLEQPKEAAGRPYNDRIDAIPGGVAIALGHGSVLIECAKKELHATTPVWKPCKSQPTRVSMVFYQHKRLTRRFHGYYEEEEKQRQRSEEALKRKMSEADVLAPQMTIVNQRPPPFAGKILSPISVNIPPTFRPSHDDLTEEDDEDVLSDCSDTIESMLHPYSMLEESDFDDDEMEDDNDDVARGIVPRATPLTDLECPFYLELPIRQLDQEPPLVRYQHYPCPLAAGQKTNNTTTTISFVSSKQQGLFSGNFVELP